MSGDFIKRKTVIDRMNYYFKIKSIQNSHN